MSVLTNLNTVLDDYAKHGGSMATRHRVAGVAALLGSLAAAPAASQTVTPGEAFYS